MPIPFAICVAVGPDPKDPDRVADLIDSVRAYESGPCHLILVDDGETDRNLATRFTLPSNWKAHSVRHPRRDFPDKDFSIARAGGGKGICAAILNGLGAVARHAPDAIFTLKMDTDALVIAPFAEKIAATLRSHPNVGMMGAYDRTPSGAKRDTSKTERIVRRLYESGSAPTDTTPPEHKTIATHIAAALPNGYRFGEHCLGGAYAVSGQLLSRMLKQNYLNDPALWLPINCPEDVMVGIYTKAVGLDFLSYVGPKEVFGVRYKGLDDTPQRLLDRGFSVIHAVKNDEKLSEEEIRRFFKTHRESKK